MSGVGSSLIRMKNASSSLHYWWLWSTETVCVCVWSTAYEHYGLHRQVFLNLFGLAVHSKNYWHFHQLKNDKLWQSMRRSIPVGNHWYRLSEFAIFPSILYDWKCFCFAIGEIHFNVGTKHRSGMIWTDFSDMKKHIWIYSESCLMLSSA